MTKQTWNQRIKVIIADDHPVFRDGLKTVLRNIPFIAKISQAASGEEVFRLIESESYDLVLMDVKMKPVNGIEATRQITQRNPQIRVIGLSMSDEEDTIVEMFQSGASGYLLKNAGSDEIKEAIHQVLDGRQYLSREISHILLDYINRKKHEESDPSTAFQNKERIREIIFLISNELSTLQIAKALCLSVRTIEYYRSQIYKTTNVRNSVGLSKLAIAKGIDKDKSLQEKFKLILQTREIK